jgi:hypothetical protein
MYKVCENAPHLSGLVVFVIESGVECSIVEQAVNLFLDLVGGIAGKLLANFCKANASLRSNACELQNRLLQVGMAHTRVSRSRRAGVHQLCRGIAVIARASVHRLTVSTTHFVVQVHVNGLQEVEGNLVGVADQCQTESLHILAVVESLQTASDAHISASNELVRVRVVVVISLVGAIEPHFNVDLTGTIVEHVDDIVGLRGRKAHDLTDECNLVDFVAVNAQGRVLGNAARLREVKLFNGER